MTEEFDFEKSLKPVNKTFDERTGFLSSFVIRSPLVSARRDGRIVPGILYPENEANNKGYALRVYPNLTPKNVLGLKPTEDELYIGLDANDIGDTIKGCCPVTVRYIEGGKALLVTVHHIISNMRPPEKTGRGAIADMNDYDNFCRVLKTMALLHLPSIEPIQLFHVTRGRGTTYTLTGYSTLQLTGPNDMSIVFNYKDAMGNSWTRLASELLDGRFSPV